MRYHLIFLDWQKLEHCIMPSVGREDGVWECPCMKLDWYSPANHPLSQLKNVYIIDSMNLPYISKKSLQKDTW